MQSCNGEGGDCSRGWSHEYSVVSNEFDDIDIDSGNWSNEQLAFENSKIAFFQMEETGAVQFFIDDSPLSDNLGGVSLHISRICDFSQEIAFNDFTGSSSQLDFTSVDPDGMITSITPRLELTGPGFQANSTITFDEVNLAGTGNVLVTFAAESVLLDDTYEPPADFFRARAITDVGTFESDIVLTASGLSSSGQSSILIPDLATTLTVEFEVSLSGLGESVLLDDLKIVAAGRELTISSSDESSAVLVDGPVVDQLAILNGSPALNQFTSVNRHSDLHLPASFDCSDPPSDPLIQPYVAANQFIDGVDEVTLDNCSSAWYRFTFEMPNEFEIAAISGIANVDDVAVVYLNGNRISAEILISDLGVDRVDSEGLPLLSWPTMDSFGTEEQDFFVSGTNELVFGVHGDLSQFEPTGVEFEACVSFSTPSLLAMSIKTEKSIYLMSSHL